MIKSLPKAQLQIPASSCKTTKATLGLESKHLVTSLGSTVGRVSADSAPRSGGTGFDPGQRHTKVMNNGTSCSLLGTRIFG